MIGMGSASAMGSAQTAINIVTYLGATCLTIVAIGFAIALYQEWKIVREYKRRKQDCKFFESLADISHKYR
ncbi:hypothetical protein [Shewanella colwelliana]|uniref:Holin n=1 Tax=Shewanella colwelliana TaxID=23 RepID=A0ABQ4NX49_SHECO|nr:hypothetical protein [Shewanella colwelliana]MDX1280032.1 hypothetical protein [Shewanella colwelliana]GIU38879.1 hypothetical protein TUM3794_12240 [Shewanella colwelliana]